MDPLRHLRRRWGYAYRWVQNQYAGAFGPLPAPRCWVFVVGCYNSGTTLLDRLLASHPQVGSMPNEGQYHTTEFRRPEQLGLPRLWALRPELFALGAEDGAGVNVMRLKRQWGARFNDVNRPVLLEKSPVNAARMRWLERHFGDARFIAIVRNGYAVAEGIHRKAGHSLQDAARQWARSNEVMLRDLPHLRHARLVRYEELTADPQGQVADLLRFLDLDPEAASIGGRTWRIHEQLAEIQDMNPRSFATLTPADRAVIEQEAGTMLRQLGYPAPPGG